MHGVDEEDAKRIAKDKAMKRIKELFENKEYIDKDYAYLFKENLVSLGRRSTQYLIKMDCISEDGGMCYGEGERKNNVPCGAEADRILGNLGHAGVSRG